MLSSSSISIHYGSNDLCQSLLLLEKAKSSNWISIENCEFIKSQKDKSRPETIPCIIVVCLQYNYHSKYLEIKEKSENTKAKRMKLPHNHDILG